MGAILLLLAGLLVLGLIVPKTREWMMEGVKEISDRAIILLLRVTSEFENELTKDGREEQKLWRERRLRNLRGLAQRSDQKRKGQTHQEV